MDIQLLKIPLNIKDIDFRVQSINKGGYATILAYKNARVDMNRLDEVCGPLNWKREHVKDNANCIVSIWCSEKKEWISKEDTGVESNAEAKKGIASDSFKRACFNWGIGRELYDYPIIKIKLEQNEYTLKDNKAYPTFDFDLKSWTWGSEFDNKGLLKLAAKDSKGSVRFNWKRKAEQDKK